jgi:hypothetical protein
VCPSDLEAFHALGASGIDARGWLTRSFVDRFDAVMVMHTPDRIVRNWENMRHKPVIWRTIGQSRPEIELTMSAYRNDGLLIVRYSPAESRLDYYAGDDAVIRFYKDPGEWRDWNGRRPVAVSIAQTMPRRSASCNYEFFRQATQLIPCELYGPGNEDAGSLCCGYVPTAGMHRILRDSRVFVYTGTFPASYSLAFIEAWMTGIPIVAIGAGRFSHVNPDLRGLYEVANLVTHGVTGFASDDVEELREVLRRLLDDRSYAQAISRAGREAAIEHFGKSTIKAQWDRFFADRGKMARTS